jgi:MoaA/NifB/PqqE/SkfB family radical SAM enzyme
MGLEFATATTHNSYYFHKNDNEYNDPEMIANEFEKIASALLRTNRPKNWFRAYFNMGLANKVRGGQRPLPCEAGTDVFFLDPFGNILPCNGSDEPMIMGNLKDQSFQETWNSHKSEEIRKQVKNCSKQCWMIGSVSPAMKKRVWVPARWVVKNKLRMLKKKGQNVYLDPIGCEPRTCAE